MKKTLLSTIAGIFAVSSSMAQFVYHPNATTPTGLSFSGSEMTTAGVASIMGIHPTNTDATCSTVANGSVTATSGTNMVNVLYTDAMSGYSTLNGSPCIKGNPSIVINAETPLNLSSSPTLSVTLTSNTAFLLLVQLLDPTFNSLLNTPAPINVLGDGVPHTYTVNFGDNVVNGRTLESVQRITLQHENGLTTNPGPLNASLGFQTMTAGTATITSVNKAFLVSNSTIFPNPSKGNTTLEFSLIETADVKVVLTDMIGKELAVLAEGNFGTGKQAYNFDANNFDKGLYLINYYVNGSPARGQKFVVSK